MAKQKQSNVTTTTQSIETRVMKLFESKFTDLKKFAEKKGHRLPKKGELMTRIIETGVANMSSEVYFGE